MSNLADEKKSGRQEEDLAVTNKVPRLKGSEETIPPPLPPSPGDKAVQGWFDSQPTYTEAKPKLRPSPKETLTGLTGVDFTRAQDGEGGVRVIYPAKLMMLLAAAALAVGMVIGAFLFGQLSANDAAAAPNCSECPPK
jgi:hypothetical protein